ncbi:hypothetical protein PYW07_012115 [Mythimna separata]|uniref:Uncharacterized protein n=1 Tax=Mythimna separata TaxID=271217 RepID=A0AAD8DS50_MYTSE|nr:hypothetical protein PYW07_012115 [Mythimna separata]
MPEDSKKNHDKKKGDPKDQRRPRQRHQQAGAEKKTDKKTEEPKNAPKVTVPQKPVYESPPPEFYKNLKRETDEILKITEEENTKYKKKEIQSNWSKYEMPIDSYEEIEEHENLGADYEKLIQAPLSIGGHFQFKHEKSWDMNTSPSLYDKYFDINMEELNIALCSIPFYERNSIEEGTFSQTDILTMNNRSTRFKQKYYNDKSYSTPEIEAQDKILNNLRDSIKEDKVEKDTSHDIDIKYDKERKTSVTENTTDNNLELITEMKTETVDIVEEIVNETNSIDTPNIIKEIEHDDFIFGDTSKLTKDAKDLKVQAPSLTEKPVCYIEKKPVVDKETPVVAAKVPQVDPMPVVPKVADTHTEAKKNPVIESPEDLEKWLDDFLDG